MGNKQKSCKHCNSIAYQDSFDTGRDTHAEIRLEVYMLTWNQQLKSHLTTKTLSRCTPQLFISINEGID